METQPKSLNIDTLPKSDEKLSSSFIPYDTLETSVKQASPSQTDYIRYYVVQLKLLQIISYFAISKINIIFKIYNKININL